MKKEDFNYYDEFMKNVDICCEISNILKQFTENFNYNETKEIENQVHKLENDADLNLHNIKNYLVKDFLPPMDEIIIDLNIYDVKELRSDFKDYVELICKICLKFKEMISSFNNSKKFEQTENIVIEINNLEVHGDRLFENSINNLYSNETNAIEVLKWHTIYECIENCIDSFESVADYVEEIIMKNA